LDLRERSVFVEGALNMMRSMTIVLATAVCALVPAFPSA
jgi:hypothetical protein